MNLRDLPVSFEQTHPKTIRILRGSAVVAFIHLMADGSGWRVRPNSSARRGQRMSWASPRKAFRAYYRATSWAKPLVAQLPDDDYRQGWIDQQRVQPNG